MIEQRKREWHIRDLVTDHQSGKLRETLVWSNIGKAIAAWALVHNVLNGTDTETLWLIVMGILTAHELIARWISQRLGGQSATPVEPAAK